MSQYQLVTGDCREAMRAMEAQSVHTCVTSPPYFGLRDYGTATWEGGDPNCRHVGTTARTVSGGDGKQYTNAGSNRVFSGDCACGATRIDQQLGLERTPDEYVANMVEVFREVRRVLRDDGTVWLNIGDSYASAWPCNRRSTIGAGSLENGKREARPPRMGANLKEKDLIGIPWKLATALRDPYYAGKMPIENDRVWISAMIDAEGSICGFRHERADDGRIRTGIGITLTNSSTAIIENAARIWPAHLRQHQAPDNPTRLGSREVFRWLINGTANRVLFLREIYPYLVAKRKQAVVAYNLLLLIKDSKKTMRGAVGDGVRAKREMLAQLLSDLNRGRTTDIPNWLVEPPSVLEPGWYLRSDVIWSKPNPMPESVTDRPTKAHEYLFLLSKSARYYYDAEAIAEPISEFLSTTGKPAPRARYGGLMPSEQRGEAHLQPAAAAKIANGDMNGFSHRNTTNGTRNRRSVWTVTTQPFAEAHFAVFPEALIEPCILAGTSEYGCCAQCGAPWERVVEREPKPTGRSESGVYTSDAYEYPHSAVWGSKRNLGGDPRPTMTTGWESVCRCNAGRKPCTVLDPFTGSGTTGVVAIRHGRNFVGCELNPAYVEMARKRINDAPLSLFAS